MPDSENMPAESAAGMGLTEDEWTAGVLLFDGPTPVHLTRFPSGITVETERRVSGIGYFENGKIPRLIGFANRSLPDGHALKLTPKHVDALTTCVIDFNAGFDPDQIAAQALAREALRMLQTLVPDYG